MRFDDECKRQLIGEMNYIGNMCREEFEEVRYADERNDTF